MTDTASIVPAQDVLDVELPRLRVNTKMRDALAQAAATQPVERGRRALTTAEYVRGALVKQLDQDMPGWDN